MVKRSHTVSRISYSKSHVALRFSATQQSAGARSIRYKKITCATAASENVSFSFSNLLLE